LLPAAAVAAWASGADARAFARIGGGLALVLAAVTAWFAPWDAAADLWRTVLVDAATSESSAVADASFAHRIESLAGILRQAERVSLAPPAAVQLGAVAACAWIGVRRRDAPAAFAGIWAGAMTAMALVDMDGRGDLYVCVAAALLAFFVVAARGRVRIPGPLGGDRAGAIVVIAVAAAGLAWAVAHRSETREQKPFGVAEQRELAGRLFALVPPERVASEGFPELHALARRTAAGAFVYFSANARHSLRRGDEDWRATVTRLLAPAEIEAVVVGRSASWDGEFPMQELAGGPSPAFAARTISLGPLCYTLLVKRDSPLVTTLDDATPCPP
jgi:hypothetical protein